MRFHFRAPYNADTMGKSKDLCTVSGCIRPIGVIKHGLCLRHYKRWLETGDVGPAKIRPNKRHRPYLTTASA